MDPRPPQPDTDKPKKHEELEEVLIELNEKGFCIGKNIGQTYLYIRQDIVDTIGEQILIDLAIKHYNITLKEVHISHYENSLCLVLPPQKTKSPPADAPRGVIAVPDKDDQKAEELVEKIKNMSKL